jgi:putative pyruvate formate lyase activating enzyme
MDYSYYTEGETALLSCCTLCPRECKVNRFEGGGGYCGMDAGLNIASICIHRGEEPPISGPEGICNIFFAGCNMHCIYCQNHEISSQSAAPVQSYVSPDIVTDRISTLLSDKVRTLGFVSPSHMVPQMNVIIRALHKRGLKPVIVYNTNGYDKQEVIDSLKDVVSIFLPDFKYASTETAFEYSDTLNYPASALRALKRMYYHKGSSLLTDAEGRALSGLLIRHLILPGKTDESIRALEIIGEELSPGIHLSLMAQYHPEKYVKEHVLLSRMITSDEYLKVASAMERLGFRNGYIQDLKSSVNYNPDFSKEHPFE